jgi:sugar O-acyltransferase (sialic acid O-acetyltransferase NeuD family)
MTKHKKLVIVGDSAFAEIAHAYFEADTEYAVTGFSVERAYLGKTSLAGLPVVPFEDIETVFDPATHAVYVAVVYTQLNRLRARLANAAKSKGYALASYISPRAFVWPNVEMGEHCFIFEDNTLQPFVRIGNNVVLWSGNHIGHHSRVNDNCFIASHAVISGFCDIGENSFIGVNATLANNVTLGRDNWISPSVTIMKDTAAGAMYRTVQPMAAPLAAPEFFKLEA